MSSNVKVFKGSINDIEDIINTWAAQNHATILNTSLCYDVQGMTGHVFVIVVYTLG